MMSCISLPKKEISHQCMTLPKPYIFNSDNDYLNLTRGQKERYVKQNRDYCQICPNDSNYQQFCEQLNALSKI